MTGRIPLHLALYATAFAAYLLALHTAPGLTRRELSGALFLAVLWRVALLFAPPLLSDDVYRSVWEGRIQQHGGNPYAWAQRPEATVWAGLRDDVWQRVNHKDYTAVYPPLWQLAVRATGCLHDSVAAVKLLLVLSEAATLLALASLLRRRGLPLHRLLVLAWSPLSLVEVAGSGHNDAFAILFLVLALLALEGGYGATAALAVALGAAAKILPGVIAIAWLRRFRLSQLPAALLLVAALAWPYREARHGMWRSLVAYSRYWRFNETLIAGIIPFSGSLEAALRVALLLLAALGLTLALRRAEPVIGGLAMVAAFIVLSGNLLPWYALWLLPFLVLADSMPALVFTGTVSLAYLAYPEWRAGGPWYVPWPIRVVEYGIPVAIALSGLGGLTRPQVKAKDARDLTTRGGAVGEGPP